MGASGQAQRRLADEEPGARERLLAAAAELFADRGYAGTSVREICAAAAVTKPTLYYYFGSKRGLVGALFSEAAGDILATLQGISADPRPLREKLKGIARIIFKRSSEAPKTCRFFYASLFAPGSAGSAGSSSSAGSAGLSSSAQDAVPAHDFDALIPQIVALTAGVFEEGRRTGRTRDVDPQLSSMVLLGALQGFCMRFVRKSDVQLTPELADRIVDAVLDGLAASSDREETR